MVDTRTPASSWLAMNSWCSPIAGQVTCRSRVSASSGNQPGTSSAHSSRLFARPPGAIQAAAAGAIYLRSVLRCTFRLPDISLGERPTYQCCSIPIAACRSNVLLAIEPSVLVPDGTKDAPFEGQVHNDTHAIRLGNYVIAFGH